MWGGAWLQHRGVRWSGAAVWATFARQAASKLKCVAALLACLCTQVEGYERSRMALAKSFFENKMRSDAAKVGGLQWSGWRSLPAVFQSHKRMAGIGVRRKVATWKVATLCLIWGLSLALPQMIQRHWRQYRLRRIRQQQTEGYQVCGVGDRLQVC